jgi:alkanesulfonate monooxygenase SsuD/methylene tetrahydromethanopterin reductase-like flavin-dependent oxidoreductase (luciferase family)
VLLPALRRPVQAAQALASIDLLSGGRLVLAVGAGFPGRFGVPQYTLSEVPWERRFTRLDETIALWRELWAAPEGGGSFQGSLLRFERPPPMIAPARAGGPPVWLGAASESALRRTGRHYDGWMPYPPSADRYASGLAAVRAAFAQASYGMPLEQLEQIQALAAGPADVVTEKLREYVAAGARHLVVRIATTTLESQREQLEHIIKLKGYL